MAYAQAVSLGPQPCIPVFDSRAVHLGFVLKKVVLRQVFLRVPRFSLSVSIHQCSILILSYIRHYTVLQLTASLNTTLPKSAVIILTHTIESFGTKTTKEMSTNCGCGFYNKVYKNFRLFSASSLDTARQQRNAATGMPVLYPAIRYPNWKTHNPNCQTQNYRNTAYKQRPLRCPDDTLRQVQRVFGTHTVLPSAPQASTRLGSAQGRTTGHCLTGQGAASRHVYRVNGLQHEPVPYLQSICILMVFASCPEAPNTTRTFPTATITTMGTSIKPVTRDREGAFGVSVCVSGD